MTTDTRRAGFTLVELVVVVVLLGAGTSFGVAMLGQIGEHVAWSERRAGLTREIRIAFERFSRDVRAAHAVAQVSSAGAERIRMTTAYETVEHVFGAGEWKRDGVVWLDAVESVEIEILDARSRVTREPERVARVRLVVTRLLGDGSITRSIDVGLRDATGLCGWTEEEVP